MPIPVAALEWQARAGGAERVSMGLDGVEFVMAVEEAFGLAIPDADAQALITPGHVVQYLEARLDPGNGSLACLEQRAFHALRRAGMAVLHRPRAAFRPDTRWEDVLPPRRRRRTWKLLHHATGVVAWPSMWLWGKVPAPCATLEGTARYLATHAAANLHKTRHRLVAAADRVRDSGADARATGDRELQLERSLRRRSPHRVATARSP